MAVQSLARSLDLANGFIRRYAYWKVLIHDLGVTLLFMLVIPMSLFLPIIEKALYRVVTYYDTIEEWQGLFYIWPNVKWGLGTLFLFLFFLLFYIIVPTGKLKLKEAFPGAFFLLLVGRCFRLCLETMFRTLTILGYMDNCRALFCLLFGFISRRS